MKKIKRLPLVAIVLVLYTFVFYSKAYSNIIPKYIIVDDYKATSNYRQWYYSSREKGVRSTVDPCSKLIRVKSRLDCGTFLDILTSRTIYVIRDICHADQE
jgi:hypothetical protein